MSKVYQRFSEPQGRRFYLYHGLPDARRNHVESNIGLGVHSVFMEESFEMLSRRILSFIFVLKRPCSHDETWNT